MQILQLHHLHPNMMVLLVNENIGRMLILSPFKDELFTRCKAHPEGDSIKES